MARSTVHPSWSALLLSSALSVGVPLIGQPLLAEEVTRQAFDIPAQDLPSALLSFSRQSGIDVILDGNLPSGLRSQPVQGNYALTQALELLVQGSGLHVEQTGAHTLRLFQQGAALELSATAISELRNPAFDNYRVPGPVYTVSREQLDRVPYSRPGDIFDTVPGVAAASSTNGAGLQLNIRGLQGMGRVKTLIDGSMQSISSYKGYPGNREDTYVDPDLIGSIEIKKGPDAGPQSAGVVGGVVNMRTLNASDIITDPEKNWGLRLKGMYGNNIATGNMNRRITGSTDIRNRWVTDPLTGNDSLQSYTVRTDTLLSLDRNSGQHYGRVIQTFENDVLTNESVLYQGASIGGELPEHNRSASLAAAWRPLENWEVTVAHAVRQSGNYISGSRGKNSWKGLRQNLADTEVFNTSVNSDSFLLKNKISFLEHHTLELGHIKYRSQSGYYSSIGTISDGSWQEPLLDAESATYTANYSWQPETPWIDLRANLWKSRLTADMAILGSAGNPDSPLPTATTDSHGTELWNTTTLYLPIGQASVKYGVSYNQEKSTVDTSGTDQASYHEYMSAKGKREQLGSFAQAQWQATSWLTLNAGLQQTRATLKDGKGIAGKRTLEALDPSYGLVLSPHEAIQVFAQWSHGSRAPSIREISISDFANPNLKMEKADNFEYGVNLLLDGMLSHNDQLGIKLSRFKNDYDDFIVRLHRGAMGEGVYGYKFANIDKAVYQGYEIAADYDAGWIFGRATLTHFDKVRYCYPGFAFIPGALVATPAQCHAQPNQNDWGGNYVPPRQEKTAGLGVRLFDRKLVLGANMKMSTDSLYGGSFRGLYNSTTVWDNYEIYDLYGSFKATKYLEVGFSVENLTDRFYIPSYSSSFEALPAPGRTARGSVTLMF